MVYINRDDFLQTRSMALADVGSQIACISRGAHVTAQVITSPFKRERRQKEERGGTFLLGKIVIFQEALADIIGWNDVTWPFLHSREAGKGET